MMGANLVATSSAMGTISLSVILEGSVVGTGRMSEAILGNAIRSCQTMGGDVLVNIEVEGKPSSFTINGTSTAEDVGATLARLGVLSNVMGMFANALRSHGLAGGGGTLDVKIDL